MPLKKSSAEKVQVRKPRCTGFEKPYAWYESEWGIAQRTIKRWVQVGRKVDEPPPLDAPDQMANWWGRHFKQRCPERFLKLAKEKGGDGNDQVKGEPLFDQPAEPERKVVPFVRPENLETGLEASVARLREAEAVANAQYAHAIAQGEDEGQIEMLQRRWERVSNQLRQQEKAMRELEGKYGAMYTESEIRQELEKIHIPIYTGVMNLLRRVKPKLDTVDDVTAQDAIWRAEVKKLFRGWMESSFSAPVEEMVVGE